MSRSSPPPITLPYSRLRTKRWPVMPPRRAFVVVVVLTTVIVLAGQALSVELGSFLQGRTNANPPFLLTPFDLCFALGWSLAAFGLALSLIFMRGAPRAVGAATLAVCVLGATPVQCGFRQKPLDRYEAGFLQWATAHVQPVQIANWQATLPPVTVPTDVPVTAWPRALASLSPSTVTHLPAGIIIEWGTFGTWVNSRRVFIGAGPNVALPTDDDNAAFLWKPLGPRFFGALQQGD